MRSRLMRSAVVVSATIVAAALSATAGAQAAPDSAHPSPAALPNDLVVALQRDLNMTPQEYLDRAAAAQRVAAYASEQRRSDSGGVGGAWLAQDGTPTVAVTTQAAANRVAAAGYRAQMVPLSTSGLESAPTVPNRRSTPPPSFHVATGTTPSTMGGDSYITAAAPIASASSYLVCSFGFAAADSAGNPLALSAGHCDPNRPATGTSNAAGVYEPKIGDLRNSRLVGSFAESGIGDEGGNLDYSVIGLVSDVVPTTGLGQPTVRGENGSTLTITGTAVPVAGARCASPVRRPDTRAGRSISPTTAPFSAETMARAGTCVDSRPPRAPSVATAAARSSPARSRSASPVDRASRSTGTVPPR